MYFEQHDPKLLTSRQNLETLQAPDRSKLRDLDLTPHEVGPATVSMQFEKPQLPELTGRLIGLTMLALTKEKRLTNEHPYHSPLNRSSCENVIQK